MSSDDAAVVVCDAGPLIHLDELECIDLLRDFSTVLVPESVWLEVEHHRPKLLSDLNWIDGPVAAPSIVDTEVEALAAMFTLHRGERDALQLVRSRFNAWLLTDDTAARLAARTINIEAHGTLGILVRAIRRSLRSHAEVLGILESIPGRSTLFIKRELLDDVLRQIRQSS